MNRYNCHNCGDRCKPKAPQCELKTLIGAQMLDTPRKIRGFVSMMERFHLKVKEQGDNFYIVPDSW
jgi:hypothetical protein